MDGGDLWGKEREVVRKKKSQLCRIKGSVDLSENLIWGLNKIYHTLVLVSGVQILFVSLLQSLVCFPMPAVCLPFIWLQEKRLFIVLAAVPEGNINPRVAV